MSERCKDLISREKAIYAVADYIHNVDRVFSTGLLSDDDCKDAAESVLEGVPSAQPEITEEDVREWCYKRCLTIIDNALYLEMRSRWLPSAQPEIIRCKDCNHFQFADNRAFGMPVKMCKWFGFEDVDDDDFCSRAERRTDV